MRRVLVTRPEPDDAATAARLEAMGLAAIRLPLTRIAPLTPNTLPDPTGYDAVALTSANAVRHAPAGLLAAMASKPCYAVGARTAKVAREAGLLDIVAGPGDAEGLARLVAGSERPGTRVLHPCGRVRTDTLTKALQGAGFAVEILETYDTQPVHHDPATAAGVIGEEPVWAALVYSAMGAARLRDLARGPRTAPLFHETRFFCVSERVATALGELEPRANAATEPSEEGLLSLVGAA